MLPWKSELFVEDSDRISPLPHAICTMLAEVDGTLADQSLTLYEMRAIMRMIAIRVRSSRRNWHIYPVSVVRYREVVRLIEIVFYTVSAFLIYGQIACQDHSNCH